MIPSHLPAQDLEGLAFLLVATLAAFFPCSALPKAPTPSQFLGFEVGSDRQLADYRQIASYFKALAASSPRIQVENLGPTTLGNDLLLAAISSEENLKNAKRYQEIARRLADPRGLSAAQIDSLVNEGKVIVLVTCNIHSTEIGASQLELPCMPIGLPALGEQERGQPAIIGSGERSQRDAQPPYRDLEITEVKRDGSERSPALSIQRLLA